MAINKLVEVKAVVKKNAIKFLKPNIWLKKNYCVFEGEGVVLN
jgi:hypothetical protein